MAHLQFVAHRVSGLVFASDGTKSLIKPQSSSTSTACLTHISNLRLRKTSAYVDSDMSSYIPNDYYYQSITKLNYKMIKAAIWQQ